MALSITFPENLPVSARRDEIMAAIAQHQEAPAMRVGFNAAFARDHDAGASVLDRVDEDIAHPALIISDAFDEKYAVRR